ncbi:hypothetical protein C8Q80DRAFT_1265683 [Daedaleopsis nitida]|nr:hypothetical protein C8Q80DRAFT_1265683 [Daedaleopsis nitida]
MSEVEELDLTVYSPFSRPRIITVLRNSKSSHIREEVEKRFTNVDTIYLLKADTVKWGSADIMLLQLKQHDLSDQTIFKPLSQSAHQQWIQTIHDGDLHLVVMRVLDMETLQVYDNPDVRADSSLAKLIPTGRTYAAYKPREKIACPLPDAVADLANSLVRDSMENVSTSHVLNSISPWGFAPGDVHFVIYLAHDAAEDTLSFLRNNLSINQKRLLYFKNTPSKPPSTGGIPSQFDEAQKDARCRIYCGRPHQHPTPPSLLDETIAKLRFDLDSIQPTPQDVRCFDSLRTAAVEIYETENARRVAFTRALTDGGILPEYADTKEIGTFRTDGALEVTCLGFGVFYYVQELKKESNTGGAEPYFEAILYFAEKVRTIITAKDCDPRWANMNFPAVLVLHFGPYLVIAVATFDGHPNVEPLCCIPLHMHDTNEKQIKVGERALAALRVALFSFHEQYPSLPTIRNSPGDFPFRDYYDDEHGTSHDFKYVGAFDGRRIFRAELQDGKGTKLCVKFCTEYSADAHRAAYGLHFAPRLRAINTVYDWTMVVMDDVSDKYTNTMHDFRPGQPRPAIEPAMSFDVARDLMSTQIRELHAKGFVHGDVRNVNVLVRNKDANPGPEYGDVLLVDFDWAGPVGKAVYPRKLNRQGVPRPLTALTAEKITPEHDVWMVDRL